jgi:hypothetical protein
VGQHIELQFERTHTELLDEMSNQDPELASRIEDLKAEDSRLLETWKQIHAELGRFCGLAKRAEPDEGKVSEPVTQLTDQALAFVIGVRKQEAALTTWYMEAFNRDRGIGD